MGPFFGVLKGAGVFRFQDGSLLIVTVVDGSGCINPTAGNAALIVNYQISGGSGRFAGASGDLKMTGTLMCWLRNASNACTFLTNTGKFEGTIFGAAPEDEERETSGNRNSSSDFVGHDRRGTCPGMACQT